MAHPVRQREIGFEGGCLGTRERLVDDVQRSFVIQAKRPVVEICRAARSEQAIDDHDLAVVHRGSVFGNDGSCAGQRPPGRPRGAAHRVAVDKLSRHHDAQLDTAPQRALQGLESQRVWHEIRSGQIDGTRRRRDGQQIHQLHALTATAG